MIDGKTLRDAMISGANCITAHRAEVDELNVFPVPDGDTGTNMSMTTAAARDVLQQLPDNTTVAQVAEQAASAMLRGARGNSGVITSLLFRGFSKALAGKKAAEAQDFAAALQEGVDSAYKAVMKPTEGTMLTVARVSSEKANESELTDAVALWDLIVDEALIALEHTPEQLEVLKKAGVVDAGGKGFCYILQGMQQVFHGEGIVHPEEAAAEPKPARMSTQNVGRGVFAHELNPDITNAYCTEFLVNKEGNGDAIKLRAYLESQGDSVVVVDDDYIIKVHVHTADPGKVLTHALQYGFLTKLKIENMHEQYVERQAQGEGLEKQAADEQENDSVKFPYAAVDHERDYGFVAVAAGEGIHSVFQDLGVDVVVSGGQTMNPSTDDILSAIQSVPAKTVFVLPNNKNIILSAEQAIPLADRKVVVVPTRTIPQGVSAMLAFNPDGTVDDNVVDMLRSAEEVDTGLVTFAARNSDFDGKKIKRGEVMALHNGKLVATGKDVGKITQRLVRSMVDKSTEFITIFSGAEIDFDDAEKTLELIESKLSSSIEVTLVDGGQPVYYYIISVE